MKRLMLAMLLCAAGAAQANSACDKPKNDFDDMYCLSKIYQDADKELNDSYGKLNSKLDADGKARLKTGQLNWIKSRNGQCAKQDGDAFFVDLQCATNTTIKRSQFLQDRTRECTGAGCQNSKL